MLRASLRSHDPVDLYDFLQKQVGPLRMLIKEGHAVITFLAELHYKIALERFGSFTLRGSRIELLAYTEDKQAANKADSRDDSRGDEAAPVREGLSREMLAVVEGLEVGNSQDMVERLVKRYKKDMVGYIANYDKFMKEAQEKMKRYSETTEESHQKKVKIQKTLQKNLRFILKTLKNNFRRLSSEITDIDQRQINLDPDLECQQLQQKFLLFTSVKEHVQYLNEQLSSCIKRLSPLNPSQFICSGGIKAQKVEGQLKIYDINQEKKKNSIACREGSYGLLVFDKYIITGTFEGYFSFYQERPDSQELTPRLFGNYNDLLTITDILPGRRREKGFNILALANKKIVKSFNVQQCELYPGISSLIFQEKHSIEKEGINTIETAQEGQQLLMGCQNVVQGYDLNKGAFARKVSTESQILRMKRVDQSLVYLAQCRAISLSDLRTSETKRFSFKASVTALCVLNQHSVIYGTERGELGLFDVRKEGLVESNTLCHKAKVNDIVKLNDFIVSGDSEGQIVSWKGC